MPGIATVLHYAWGFLLFLLFTVETNDLFRKFMSGPGADQEALSFQRYMTEALVWAFLAIAFGWGARQRKLSPLLYSGIVVMFLAMGMVAIRGIAFAPVEQFALLANYRALAMVGVIGAAFVMTSVLGTMKEVEWSRESADAIGVFSVVLILVLLTGETRDFFEKRLSLLTGSGSGTTDSKTALENMKQLSLSGVWLLYSISLMAIGIWRHRQSLRISCHRSVRNHHPEDLRLRPVVPRNTLPDLLVYWIGGGLAGSVLPVPTFQGCHFPGAAQRSSEAGRDPCLKP